MDAMAMMFVVDIFLKSVEEQGGANTMFATADPHYGWCV